MEKPRKTMIRTAPLFIAAALVTQVFAQTPNPSPAQQAEVLYRQGLAAQNDGDPVAARAAFSKALQKDPNHANARYSLGQLSIDSAAISAKGRAAKFGAVMIPEVKFEDASLREALESLQAKVEKESKDQVAPNFVIEDPKSALANAKITLALKNTPAGAILKYVLEQARAKARYDEHAIVITPN